jgi:23S rRNA pseudouridine2457 synthase
MFHYFLIHKPYQVASQFSSLEGKQTLRDWFSFPNDVYPVGRLDYDSEGLLLLTNDKKLNHLLLHPTKAHTRTYWVQVDGDITEDAVQQLRKGVEISIDGKTHRTAPCSAKRFLIEPPVHPRTPPIRFRAAIPAPWISLSLTEGKNRQVRRMTAKIGFPTLRLIRYSIEDLTLEGLAPGEYRKLDQKEVYQQLHIR